MSTPGPFARLCAAVPVAPEYGPFNDETDFANFWQIQLWVMFLVPTIIWFFSLLTPCFGSNYESARKIARSVESVLLLIAPLVDIGVMIWFTSDKGKIFGNLPNLIWFTILLLFFNCGWSGAIFIHMESGVREYFRVIYLGNFVLIAMLFVQLPQDSYFAGMINVFTAILIAFAAILSAHATYWVPAQKTKVGSGLLKSIEWSIYLCLGIAGGLQLGLGGSFPFQQQYTIATPSGEPAGPFLVFVWVVFALQVTSPCLLACGNEIRKRIATTSVALGSKSRKHRSNGEESNVDIVSD